MRELGAFLLAAQRRVVDVATQAGLHLVGCGAEFAACLAGGQDAYGCHGDACHDAVSGAGVRSCGFGRVYLEAVHGGEGGKLLQKNKKINFYGFEYT